MQQDLARTVEAQGYRSLWTNEARGRDALVLSAASLSATSSIDVGVGDDPRGAIERWADAGLDHAIARVVSTGPDVTDDVRRVVSRFRDLTGA